MSDTNIGLEKQIWNAACAMWGHIPAADYRKVIIGLIFLKYISSVFEKKYNRLLKDKTGLEEDKNTYIKDNIFFVPKIARWSNISKNSQNNQIGQIIDNAMSAIEAENETLKDILPKNYSNPDLDKRVLGNVVDLFTKSINLDEIEHTKDLLGRTYEYCISQFAAYEGAKGGEFYTPSSIVKTIVSILKPYDNCKIYDPCCGSGGMFVQFIKTHGAHHKILVYGQESNPDTWKMAKMNMALRGIEADFGYCHADTFFNDLHPNLKADFIMANPPFNLSNQAIDELQKDDRWVYGTPPSKNANYAWIEHMIYHLAPYGKIGLVLANGALSAKTNAETQIRKKIIKDDLIEGIIALPSQLFYSVSIPVTLWFITKNKKQKGKTLFIDARNFGSMADKRHRYLKDDEINKLSDTFFKFQNGTLKDIKGFCKIASLDDIVKKDYILTPMRYIEPAEKSDITSFNDKMEKLTSELGKMFVQSDKLQSEIKEQLKNIGFKIVK